MSRAHGCACISGPTEADYATTGSIQLCVACGRRVLVGRTMPVANAQSSAVVSTSEVGDQPSMEDLPDQLTVTAGDEAQVRFPSLAAAGYKWAATSEDPRIVEASIRFEDASALGS